MALTFPNQSRSYDPGKRSIRFTGYDGVFEISVFFEVAILQAMTKERISDETHYLTSFDGLRATIERYACKAYSRKRSATIVLTAADIK